MHNFQLSCIRRWSGEQASGVLFFEDVSVRTFAHVNIDGCRHDGAEAEEPLDMPQIDSLFQQQGPDRVPEHMRCDMPQFESGGGFSDHVANRLLAQTPSRAIGKQIMGALSGDATNVLVKGVR